MHGCNIVRLRPCHSGTRTCQINAFHAQNQWTTPKKNSGLSKIASGGLRLFASGRSLSVASFDKSARPPISKKAAGGVNIQHNFAIQKFSKPPYNLKTNVAVVSHHQGYLATLEWKWFDPNRQLKLVAAVTTGIHSNRKLAISEAFMSMLAKQKLLPTVSSSGLAQDDRMHSLVTSGRYREACKLIATEPDVLEAGSATMLDLWRNVTALHDYPLTENIVNCLVRVPGGVQPSVFESFLQEVVFLSDPQFAERAVRLLSAVKLGVSERGFGSDLLPSSSEDVSEWKRWRTLIAFEEIANLHAALSSREPTVRMRVTDVTAAVVQLVGKNEEMFPSDSLVLLCLPGSRSVGLTGKVTSCTSAKLTVKLLTEEAKSVNRMFTSEFLDCVLLTESRVTFDRIAAALRQFYRVTPIPDSSHRFCPKLADLLRRGVGGEDACELRAKKNPEPDYFFPKNVFDRMKSTTQTSSLSPSHRPNSTAQSRSPCFDLSTSQKQAVLGARHFPLSLIQGPPGTGKTHTLAAVVAGWAVGGKTLACADSNAAADNIHGALIRAKVGNVFRLSAWRRVDEQVSEEVLGSVSEGAASKYRRALAGYAADPTKGWGYLVGARRALEEECVKGAAVVVTTLASTRHPILDKHTFINVVVDEAAQTIEPAVLLAISHGCEKLVLIGDHKQLPAVVLSSARDLSVSLFERLMSAETVPSVLLNSQRRMHPTIAEFPNENFYAGQIYNHETVITTFPQIRPPVVFVDTDGEGGGEDVVGTSTRNLAESRITAKVVRQLIGTGGIQASELGVIVPYLAQKAQLQRMLPFRDLQIDTVEGYQGHEKNFIVISTVRSNPSGFLGFLNDDRRMNVMLTRARQGLIVIGDKQTLTSRPGTWSDWVRWCEARGCVVRHDSPILASS